MTETASAFLVARNPDAESSCRSSCGSRSAAGIVLKAATRGPRPRACTATGSTGRGPSRAEIIEETRSFVPPARRRGRSRARPAARHRSQFVFIAGGGAAIFWQTRKVARTANPGARIPRRRALDRAAS